MIKIKNVCEIFHVAPVVILFFDTPIVWQCLKLSNYINMTIFKAVLNHPTLQGDAESDLEVDQIHVNR